MPVHKMTTDDKAYAQQVEQLCKAIAPLLAGRPPEVQSAALADLTATWLCGHVLEDPEPGEVRQLRAELMANFNRLVGEIARLNDHGEKFAKRHLQ